MMLISSLMLVVSPWLARRRPRLLIAAALVLLIGVYAGAIGAIRPWNLFHYYLGSKYYDELGYTDLYPCAVQRIDRAFNDFARDLETYEWRMTADLANCPRENFTIERWDNFGADLSTVIYSDPTIGNNILLDKGLNTTPFWLAISKPLANMAPINSDLFWLVITLDLFAIIGAVVAIYKLADLQSAALAIAFIAGFWPTFGKLAGNWLQYIWLLPLVVGCLLFKKKPVLSGLSIGLAAGLRLFPVFFILPAIGGKRWQKITLAAFLGAVFLVFLIGSWSGRGPGAWLSFGEKIRLQAGAIINEPLNIGLENTISTVLSYDTANRHYHMMKTADVGPLQYPTIAIFDHNFSLAFVVSAPIIAVIAWYVLRSRGWPVPTFGRSILLIFAVLTLSRYYWLMLVVLLMRPGHHREGLMILAAVGLVAVGLAPLLGWLIFQVCLFVYLIFFVLIWPARIVQNYNHAASQAREFTL